MNMASFNTKHGTPEWHQERMARVRKVAKKLGVSISILLDLQGPEIRINVPNGMVSKLNLEMKLPLVVISLMY
jgi:pyruvate kinase